MAGLAATSPAVMGVLALHTTMLPLGRLSATCLLATMRWVLVALLLPGAGNSLVAVPMRSQARQCLCCLSAWALVNGVRHGWTEAAGATTCSASGTCSTLATGALSGSAAVVVVAAVAAALAGASAVTVLLSSKNLVGVAIAAANVAGGMDVTSALAAARGKGAGNPQKGTATMRNCNGCGVMTVKGVTSASVMGAKGLLRVAGLERVSSCGGALLLSGCCWLSKRLMVAGLCALPVPRLFSLLELDQLFSLLELMQLVSFLEIRELFSLLELQAMAMIETLLSPTRALLPMLNGVMGFLPPLTEVPSPLTWGLPAAGEGLAAVPKIASSLRLTEGSTAEPDGGEKVLLVPGVVPADEEQAASLKATASWRACASQQQLCHCIALIILTDMRGQEAATLHLLLLVRTCCCLSEGSHKPMKFAASISPVVSLSCGQNTGAQSCTALPRGCLRTWRRKALPLGCVAKQQSGVQLTLQLGL